MALTPEDVVNKRFQPTKFREGYDQDEVDDFLDEVVVELRRLNQENEELRQRLIASDARIGELQRTAAQPAPAQASSVQASPVQSAPVPQPEPAPVVAPPAYQSGTDETTSTNNLLQLARRLHEEHVREGVEKRDALISEGHATAARIVGDAETKQRAQLGVLDQERQVLEHRIDELRTFEREYRQKLKGYIEGQLRELDASGGTTPSTPSQPSAAQQAAPQQHDEPSSGQQFTDSPQQFAAPVAVQPPNYTGFAGN